MANLPRRRSPLETFGEGQVDLFLSFPPNGASSPASFGGAPFVTGVVRNSTGKYTVTIDAGFRPKALIGISSFAVRDNANPGITALAVENPTIVAGSATTVELYTSRAGVLVDVAANAASLVKCQLRFKTYPKTDATGL